MNTPGKLTVTRDGRVTGAAHITINHPFPCVNGRLGVTGRMNGVLMHTMVGNLPGTVAAFNNPSFQASAHFGIAQDGEIHQFGPLGKGWEAWHAMAANPAWYGIEHADNGNPDHPLTSAQITASAQVVECLSAFAGFPLQITNSMGGDGYGTHSMGGAAWGGHTCPDLPPEHVRSHQRGTIVSLARLIRAPVTPPLPPPVIPPPLTEGPAMIIIEVAQDALPAGTPWPGIFLLQPGTAGPPQLWHIPDTDTLHAYEAAGIPVRSLTFAQYKAIGGA